jgi:hypothetical protein
MNTLPGLDSFEYPLVSFDAKMLNSFDAKMLMVSAAAVAVQGKCMNTLPGLDSFDASLKIVNAGQVGGFILWFI